MSETTVFGTDDGLNGLRDTITRRTQPNTRHPSTSQSTFMIKERRKKKLANLHVIKEGIEE